MREFVRSWSESLGYLKPTSLKQWGLVTLKKSAAAYVTLGINFWLLLILVGIVGLLLIPLLGARGAFSCALLFLLVGWVIFTVLVVRPSLEKKDFSYFLKYGGHSLVALCMVIFFSLVMIISDWFLHKKWEIFLANCIVPYYDSRDVVSQIALFFWAQSYYLVLFVFHMPLIFMLFFLFDNVLSVKLVVRSIWWGIKLMLYTLPLCLIISVGAQSIVEVLSWTRSHIQLLPVEYEFFFLCLLFPFYFSFLIYIYITQVHSHPEKY